MSAADLSRALQAFDDQALATLANVGLVRRAQRDLASGKIALEAVEDGTARLLVDGQIVALGAAGPAAASCDCPAMGVCRHRIAAVLFLRDLDGTADAADTQADAPPGDPQDIVSAISLEDARKFAGRPGWRAALELLVEVTGVEVAETSIGVTFAGLDEAVLILRGQGIAGVVSKAAKAKKKPYHAAALIAARRHFGLPEDGLEADDPVAVEPQGPVPPDPQFLRRVQQALADCTELAFNLAPEPLEESLFALSVSSRADALPRLAAILRGIAAQMRLKRARSFEFDAAQMLELLATAFALSRAVGTVDPAAPGFARLAGQVRRDYAPVEALELLGCGADVWRSAAGARGMTAHFLQPDTGQFYSVSLARGAGQDPTFEPQQAFRHQAIWQAGPLATLAHARIRLTGAGVADGGRLSAGKDARAEILEAAAQPNAQEADICSDWEALHEGLAQDFGLGIAVTGQAKMALLAPADCARPQFDELAQRLVWPVRDLAGRWLGLTLDHDERSNRAIARLEEQLRGGWRGMVLVRATQQGHRIALAPITLFGRGAPVDLSIAPVLFRQREERDFIGWLRRLRPGPGQALAMQQPSQSARAVDAAWKHVLDRLEAGPQLARLLDYKRTAHAARLTDYGMAWLGEMLGQAEAGDSLLAAAYALLVARQQRTELPLLL
ncbi:MAG: hypothetical protein KDE15_02965 [Erythrobacter sp.]|nr:hypothetical protein [Erythrobacter sp.]